MWIINWLPEFIVHLIFLAGIIGTIAGFVLGFIPFISKYKLPIQIISLLLLSLGVYLEGGLAEKAKWELRVKEMEAKVAEAEAKSAVVNTQIVEKVVTQKQIVKEKGDKIVQYIDREIKVFDNTCTVPELAIKAHNMAAKNETPEDKK
jgi:hypothetical protein